jgi:hypothetical protein
MFAGLDTKPFVVKYEKDGALKKFNSHIGVIVFVEDFESFRQKYYSILQEVFNNTGIKLERKVLSSYELLELTQGNYSMLYEFCEKIKPLIKSTSVFYTGFNTQQIPKIRIFGRTSTPRFVGIEEFMVTHIDQAFPHICIWRTLVYLRNTNTTVFSDSFTTNLTEAWDSIIQHPNLFEIFPNGDSLNPLISTADMLVKYIDQKVKDNKEWLNRDSITRVLGNENLYVHRITNSHLRNITPLRRMKFNFNDFIRHPVFFIIKPKNSKVEIEFVKFHSPTLLNRITDSNGSLMYFDQRKHPNYIVDGDTLIYSDAETKSTAENIASITRKRITIMNISDF